MNRDTAKVVVAKRVLQKLVDDVGAWWTHKDLFYPTVSDDKPVADAAASKPWQKKMMDLLIELRAIKRDMKAEGTNYIPGYDVTNRSMLKKFLEDQESIHWLLAPLEIKIPSWIENPPKSVSDRKNDTPQAPEPNRPSQDEDFVLGLLNTIAASLTAIEQSNRRIEDRISKMDVKMNDFRDNMQKLMAASVSDVRLAAEEIKKGHSNNVKLFQEAVASQNQLVFDTTKKLSLLALHSNEEYEKFLRSLDLHSQYSEMMGKVREFRGAVEPIRNTIQSLSGAASSLEAGLETAMDLAAKIEGGSHGSR